MAGDLQPYFRGSGLDTPPDTRARAAKTMEILKGLLPRDLSSTDPATVMRAIGQATGKPGALAVAGMAGAGAAAEDDPQRAMLVDLIRRVQAGEI